MAIIARFFTSRPEFREAVAREVDCALVLWNRNNPCFSQHVAKTVHCLVDSEYEVFCLESPSRVSGLIDLSEMRGGDRVEVSVCASVAGRKECLLDRWVLDNYQPTPIFVLPWLVLPKGARVTLKQSRGVDIGVGIEMFAFE